MKRFLLILAILILAGMAWFGMRTYLRLTGEAVHIPEGEAVVYVDSTITLKDIREILIKQAGLNDTIAFKWMARRAKLNDPIPAGRYVIKDGMSIRQLVNMFRAGLQKPLMLVIRPMRSLDDFCLYLGDRLSPSPADFRDAILLEKRLSTLGLTREQALLMFIPDSYEVWWTSTAEAFVQRMAKEYNRFWNDERRAKAESIGLSPAEAGILASIVQEETNKREEMARIAGVYLNRLKRGMLLQADPTVKFAVGNPGLRRILFKHLELDSPYNTYIYKGLPPGPLNMPEPFVIDAVLNAEMHSYLFFCARADLSGYHVFARTHSEHSRNATAYRRALNERRIFE